MTHGTRIEPVASPCAVIDGIQIFIDHLSLTPEHVSVHLLAIKSDVTDRLDQEYREELFAWQSTPRGKAPPWPAERYFGRLACALQDDLKTRYLPQQYSVGGSDNEWRATWRFGPAVPSAARTLEITTMVDGTPGSVIPIAFA